jgi:hypothetical protein
MSHKVDNHTIVQVLQVTSADYGTPMLTFIVFSNIPNIYIIKNLIKFSMLHPI